MLHIPKLQIPNTLPRPRVEPPIRNRDCDTRAYQRTFHMRWHIITALRIVAVQTLALLVLRHDTIQSRAHVGAHIFVPVLVQAERARGVLDKEVQKAGFVVLDLGEFFEDCVGDEVGASAARGECELLL